MKIANIYVAIRAAESLCRIELIDISQFCTHTDFHFQERIRQLKRQVAQEAKPNPDDEDAAYGYEMWTEDRFLELKQHRSYGRYFGVLMVFSALERFFQSVYDLTAYLAMRPELREVSLRDTRRRLVLDDFKAFFKSLDIDLSKPPYEWAHLVKLQKYRNAIAHQGGWVTEVNLRLLSTYGHKMGDRLDITLEEVKRNANLVETTSSELSKNYIEAMEKRGFGK